MRELAARLVLAAGFLAAAWHFWFTPPELIAVRAVDFAKEYQEEYGAPKRQRLGALFGARELVRRATDPGSAEQYREKTMSSRPLPPQPAITPEWTSHVAAAAEGRGPFADRLARKYVYFDSSEPPLNSLAPALRDSLRRTSFTNAWLNAGGRDLEFMIYPEPHSSSAPLNVVYPARGRAAIFALAGLLFYILLTLRAPSGIRHDPVPIRVLDVFVAICAALAFGLPLRIYPSTQAALEDLVGGTGFFWAVSGLLLLLLLALARRAAYRILVDPHGISFRGLIWSSVIPWGQIAGASVRETHGFAEGLDLWLAGGRREFIAWTGMMDFLTLIHALRQRFPYLGLTPPPPPEG